MVQRRRIRDFFLSEEQQVIAPSLLSADFGNLDRELKLIENAGADWLHLDIMDGHFVPNLTMGPALVKSLRSYSGLFFDAHLMVDKPEDWIEPFAKAGVDLLTVHVECLQPGSQIFQMIKDRGLEAGISLKPSTPLESLKPFLEFVDLVLVMTVEPGFSGQNFMPEPAKNLKVLKEWASDKKTFFYLQVDGGINAMTSRYVQDADILVAGNAIFKSENYEKAIADLRGTV